jgi:hypothetical protein
LRKFVEVVFVGLEDYISLRHIALQTRFAIAERIEKTTLDISRLEIYTEVSDDSILDDSVGKL